MEQQQQEPVPADPKVALMGSLATLLPDEHNLQLRATVGNVVMDLDSSTCAGLMAMSQDDRRATLLQRAQQPAGGPPFALGTVESS